MTRVIDLYKVTNYAYTDTQIVIFPIIDMQNATVCTFFFIGVTFQITAPFGSFSSDPTIDN